MTIILKRSTRIWLALLAACACTAAIATPLKAADHYSIVDLGTLGGTFSSGSAINNNGWVTGQSATGNFFFPFLPFAWQWAGDLIPLYGFGSGQNDSADAINDQGFIVGNAQYHDGKLYPVRWRASGGQPQLRSRRSEMAKSALDEVISS